jgi:osmotically-inducible protein OsmY
VGGRSPSREEEVAAVAFKAVMRDSPAPAIVVLMGATALMLTFASWAAARPADDYTDQDISDAVSLELLIDQGVPSHLIDVWTVGGVVTLSGSVSSLMARERAADVVETVRGVRSVVNRIEVKTPDRSDEAIARDIEKELLVNPVTESWQVEAKCEDGRVTLTGNVESWQEKQLAVRLARSVRGVSEVENYIAVDYANDRPDFEIKEEIENALTWDVYVDDAMISVTVENGEVSLTGTVGSAAEKSQAVAQAWVAGVESVDADDLEVAEWARDDRLRTGKYVTRSDDAVVDAVEDAFLYDPRVKLNEIDVSADDGVVTLSGTVGSLDAKRAAAEDARNTVGVWRVMNLIAVRPASDLPDSTIEQHVREALARNPFFEADDISVRVENGLVTLEGMVQTWFEKGEADNVAARVEGVVDVENDLAVVNPIPLTYRPYVDLWRLRDFDWHPELPRSTSLGDWEIEQSIEDELWWSPFVDSEDITVTVEDGVAELTGTVDTMAERAAAQANAYQGGAIYVDNDLVVEFGPPYYP